MSLLDDEEYRRWRAAAHRAVQAADVQAASGLFEWSCFLAEQAAQLGVKALLHGAGAGAWGHDLAALVAMVPDAAGPAWPDEAGAPAERLSRFYLPTRYPDAIPGGVPGDRFTSDDADAARADATWLLAAVDATWQALTVEAANEDPR